MVSVAIRPFSTSNLAVEFSDLACSDRQEIQPTCLQT
jgi:hypothetical protein